MLLSRTHNKVDFSEGTHNSISEISSLLCHLQFSCSSKVNPAAQNSKDVSNFFICYERQFLENFFFFMIIEYRYRATNAIISLILFKIYFLTLGSDNLWEITLQYLSKNVKKKNQIYTIFRS